MSDENITLEDSVNDFLSPFNNYKPFKNMLLSFGVNPKLYSPPDWKPTEIRNKNKHVEGTQAVAWLSHNKILLSLSEDVQGMETSGFVVYDIETNSLTDKYMFSPGVLISYPFLLPKLNKIGFNRYVDNYSSKLLPALYFMDLTSKEITSVSEKLYSSFEIFSPSENLLLLNIIGKSRWDYDLFDVLSLNRYKINHPSDDFLPAAFLSDSDLLLFNYKTNDLFKMNIYDQKLTSFKNIQKTKIFGISPDRNFFVYEKDSLLRVEKTGLDLFGKKFSPLALQFYGGFAYPKAFFSPDNQYIYYLYKFTSHATKTKKFVTQRSAVVVIDLQKRTQTHIPNYFYEWRPLPRGDLK